jgi:hypothetical protein
MKTKTILLIVAVGLVVAAYFVAARSMRDFIEKRLSDTLHEKVTLQAAHLTFPPGILLTGVSAPSVSIQQVAVRVSPMAILRGQPGLDLEVNSPKLFVERGADGQMKLPLSAPSAAPAPSAPADSGKPAKKAIPFSRLRVRAGELTFADRKVSPEVTWAIRDLRISLKQGRDPGGMMYGAVGELQQAAQKRVGSFELKGEFLQESTGEADLTIRHEALEQLSPYVRPILGSSPSRGSFDLTSKITIHEGMLVADNKLTIRNLGFATDEPTILGPVGGRLVELLQDSSGVIHLAFVVKGKLGGELDWSDLFNSTLRQAMQQALARNIHKVLTDTQELNSIEDLINKGLESLGR